MLALILLFAAAVNTDEVAVRDVVAKYVVARDAADPKAIGALFTSDADQLVSSGEWRKGHDDVVKGTVASSARETGKRTITVEWVRFVTKDVALAEGRYEIGERKMWTSLILKREPSGWKISAIRNMLPAAAR